MLVEIKISYDPKQETIDQAIAALTATAKSKPAETPAPKKSVSAETPAVPKTSAPAEAPAAPAETPAAKPTESAVTMTDIRAIATALSKAGKKEELKAALAAFGSTKLSGIAEADYPALKEKLEAINA